MKLKSLKNNVTLDNNIVIKQYIDGDFGNELRILTLLQGKINCPKVLYYTKNILHLEFIDGPLFLDEVLSAEHENDCESIYSLFSLLFTYLHDFYSLTGNIFGDINFRNFIVMDSKIYGIDFEDAKTGDVKTEISDFLAYFLAYNPKLSQFKLSCLPTILLLANNIINTDITEFDIFLQLDKILQRRGKKNS